MGNLTTLISCQMINDMTRLSDGSWVDNSGRVTWYNADGQLSREDGPAVININNNVRWFYCDTEYRFSNWCYKVGCSDEAKMMLRLRYG